MSTIDDLCPGRRIGNYVLEGLVGRGAFAQVWRAVHHERPARVVALKLAIEPEFRRQLAREGGLPDIQHPNVAPILDSDTRFAEIPYLVMPFYAQGSLAALIARNRHGLPEQRVQGLLTDTLAGLSEAHSKGVVHRDIKPQNILLDDSGQAVVADFGLATWADDGITSLSVSHSASRLVDNPRSIAGTLAYIAPEILDGDAPTPAADVFATGVMLFEMLTGRRPAGPELPSQVRPGLSNAACWDSLYSRSCCSRTTRFADAAEFARAALAEFGRLRQQPRGSTPRATRRSLVYAVIPTGLFFAVVAILLFIATRSQDSAANRVRGNVTTSNTQRSFTAEGVPNHADPASMMESASAQSAGSVQAEGALSADRPEASPISISLSLGQRTPEKDARATEDEPADPDISHALRLAKSGDYKGAFLAMRTAVSRPPSGPLGDRAKRLAPVLAFCNTTLETEPSANWATLCRAYVKNILQQDLRGALADCDAIIQTSPRLAAAHYVRAGVEISLGDIEHGISDATAAIAIDESFGEAYHIRGAIYYKKGMLAEAEADLTRAISFLPDPVSSYFFRGQVYQRKRDSERAIADYTKAIELQPTGVDAYRARGLQYAGLRRQDLAINDYSAAIRNDPRDAQAYRLRGLAYGSIGDLRAAIADCTSAIELAPGDHEAYVFRASCYLDSGELERAKADCTKTIELKPDYADAYLLRARTFLALKDRAGALSDFTSLIRLVPDDANGYFGRGAVYVEMGEAVLAKKDLTEALRKRPAPEVEKNARELLSTLKDGR